MHSKFSLKFRLIAIVGLITVLSTALLAQLASRFSREQIQTDQGLLLQEVANSMASRLGQDLHARATEILLLTRMDEIRDPAVSAAKKRKLFEELKAAYPFYAWLGITDQHGNILVGTDGLLVGKNVAKREWFQQGSKGLHFGNAHDAFLLAKLMPKPKWDDLPLRLVDVSAPVVDDEGKLLGVICGHLSLDWAFEARKVLLDNIADHGVDLVVLNDSGKVLMGTPTLPSLQVDLSRLNSWSRPGAPAVETWPDEHRYLTVLAPESIYKSYSGMGWSVIVRKSEAQAFAPARHIGNSILGIGLGTAILLGLFIWFFIGRQLRPLQAISVAAERIRQGDIRTAIPRLEGNDEIAIVSQSLSELVTSLLSRNEELRLSNRVFEESAQGIVITDDQRQIVRVNQAFSEITHYRHEEVLGQNPSLLSSGHHDAEFYQKMWQSIEERGFWRGEIWNRNKLDEVYPEWLTISVLRDEHGKVSHYIGLFTDISEKKAYEDELLRMANYDPLTGLPNRNLLQEKIFQTIEQAAANEEEFSLLFIDLDKFKHINDTIGHPSGDIILQEVASRFLSIIDHDCTLARWGGDEFVLVVPQSDIAQGKAMAKRVLESLSLPFELGEVRYHVNASVGIACYPGDSSNVEGLLRCADTAMYKAKQSGENRYQLYERSMNSSVERFLLIDNAMRSALSREMDGFSLVYQPQYDIDGKAVVGAEVLVRWNDRQLGQISPAEFIPIAEEARLINTLGQWIFDTAMQQLRQYLDQGGVPLRLSLNCSPHQLDMRFVAQLTHATEKHAISPGQIRLEVTESAIMNDERRVLEVLNQLRELGYTISIDDFGTGFSRLQYIQQLRPQEIKIESSFVQGAASDENSRNIISFAVGLAQSMGITVVAEGVETQEQLDMLRAFDGITIQGYLYSKPLPFPEFLKVMQGYQSE